MDQRRKYMKARQQATATYQRPASRHGSLTASRIELVPSSIYFFIFIVSFYIPAQLLGCFTLSDLLDKPRSQVRVFPSPYQYFPSVLARVRFSIPTFQLFQLVDFHGTVTAVQQYKQYNVPLWDGVDLI